MNLLIILAAVFGGLFLLVTLLEGKAKPLSNEQAGKLSKWTAILVFVSIIAAIISRLV